MAGVLEGDLLGAKMLLYRHRVVCAALDCRVVGDDHDLVPSTLPDAGHDPRPGRFIGIHPVGGQCVELEKGPVGIDEPLDPLAHRQLAALAVPCDRALVAAGSVARQLGGAGVEVVD